MIYIRNLTKSYGQRMILNHINLELESNKTYCLMGTSGIGKTTFIRILLGLEQEDEGTVSGLDSHSLTAVFQEDRLCESFSPLENVMLASKKDLSSSDIIREMKRLLPEECLTRPVHTLSGGMKRRTAILRALLAPSTGILMDEPFSGLDESTKHLVIQYIKEQAMGKFLMISTHQEEDITLLGGSLITFR